MSADPFEAHRTHLRRVAYLHLGSLDDADDVVQDAWLRLQRANAAEIRDLRAWLTTVVSRLALDALRSARARREHYVGPWLPEPLVADVDADPADRVTLDDVFHLSFGEVADVVSRTPAAVRQLASRARTHVDAGRPRVRADRAEQERLVGAFAQAALEGDFEGLVAALDPNVVGRSDGGGRVLSSLRPQTGARHVARALLALSRKSGPARSARPALVNGALGIVLEDGSGILQVISLTVDGGRITAIDMVRNPDKLTRVPAP